MKDVFAKIARVVMRWIRVAMRWVRAVIPVAGDSRKEWVRKIAFLTALIVFIGSGFYLVYEVLIQPYYTQEITHSMRDLYTDGENAETESKDDPIQQIKVPEYIAPSFAALYRREAYMGCRGEVPARGLGRKTQRYSLTRLSVFLEMYMPTNWMSCMSRISRMTVTSSTSVL